MAFATAPRMSLVSRKATKPKVTKPKKPPKPRNPRTPRRVTTPRGATMARMATTPKVVTTSYGTWPSNLAKPNLTLPGEPSKPDNPIQVQHPRGTTFPGPKPPVLSLGPVAGPSVPTGNPPAHDPVPQGPYGQQPPGQVTLPGGAETKMPLESAEGAEMRQGAQDTYGFDLPDINKALLNAAIMYGGAPSVEQAGFRYDPATERAVDESYQLPVVEDPNSIVSQIGRSDVEKTRSLREGMNDAGSYFSGAHQFAQGELTADIGRQRLKAKSDFDQAMYELNRRLMQARYTRDTALRGATAKDIEAELARPKEPREDPNVSPTTGKPATVERDAQGRSKAMMDYAKKHGFKGVGAGKWKKNGKIYTWNGTKMVLEGTTAGAVSGTSGTPRPGSNPKPQTTKIGGKTVPVVTTGYGTFPANLGKPDLTLPGDKSAAFAKKHGFKGVGKGKWKKGGKTYHWNGKKMVLVPRSGSNR